MSASGKNLRVLLYGETSNSREERVRSPAYPSYSERATFFIHFLSKRGELKR